MFGSRYFSKRYFAQRYFGPREHIHLLTGMETGDPPLSWQDSTVVVSTAQSLQGSKSLLVPPSNYSYGWGMFINKSQPQIYGRVALYLDAIGFNATTYYAYIFRGSDAAGSPPFTVLLEVNSAGTFTLFLYNKLGTFLASVALPSMNFREWNVFEVFAQIGVTGQFVVKMNGNTLYSNLSVDLGTNNIERFWGGYIGPITTGMNAYFDNFGANSDNWIGLGFISRSPSISVASATAAKNGSGKKVGINSTSALALLRAAAKAITIHPGLFYVYPFQYSYYFGGVSSAAQFLAQTVTAVNSTTYYSLTLKINNSGAPTDGVFVEVYSGTPTGTLTLLATSDTIRASAMTTASAGTLQKFNFTSGFTFTAGSQYTIIVKRSGDGSDVDNYIWLWASDVDYPGGIGYYTLNGTTWGSTGGDFYFDFMDNGIHGSLIENNAVGKIAAIASTTAVSLGNKAVGKVLAISGLTSTLLGKLANKVLALPYTKAISDNFNRANSALEDSPVMSGGDSWSHDTINSIAGAAIISSNKLGNNTSNAEGSSYYYDLGSRDQTITFTLLDTSANSFITMRMTDQNDYVGIRASGSNFQIWTRRNAIDGFVNRYNVNQSVVSGDQFTVTITGSDTIVVKKNGTQIISTNIGVTQTGTRVGIHCRQAVQNPLIEDFSASVVQPATAVTTAKAAGKLAAIASATTTAAATAKAFLKALAVGSTTALSLKKSGGKTVSVASTTATTLKRSVARVLAIASTSTTSIKRAVTRKLAVVSSSVISLPKAVSRRMPAIASTTSATARRIAGKVIKLQSPYTISQPVQNSYQPFGTTATNTTAGQSLTPSVDLTINSVSFGMWKTGAPTDNVYVEILDSTGTVQLGVSNQVAASAISSGLSNILFTFPTPVQVSAGAQIILNARRTGALDISNSYVLGCASPNPTSGALAVSTNTGAFSFYSSASTTFTLNAVQNQSVTNSIASRAVNKLAAIFSSTSVIEGRYYPVIIDLAIATSSAISRAVGKLVRIHTNPRGFYQTNSGDNGGNWTGAVDVADDKSIIIVGSWFDGTAGSPWISTDKGDTWAPSTTGLPSTDYSTVATSGDGNLLAVATYSGSVYISTNRGTSWTQPDPTVVITYGPKSLKVSTDGSTIYALDASGSGGLVVSNDSGATWNVRTGMGSADSWSDVACSSDGQIAYVIGSTQIWKTVNGGVSWAQVTTLTLSSASSITCSSDGQVVNVIDSNSWPTATHHRSFDGGVTWATTTPFSHGFEQAVSADGSTIFTIASVGSISGYYRSTDFGATYNLIGDTLYLSPVPVCTADGKFMAALNGDTWTFVAYEADGLVVTAAKTWMLALSMAVATTVDILAAFVAAGITYAQNIAIGMVSSLGLLKSALQNSLITSHVSAKGFYQTNSGDDGFNWFGTVALAADGSIIVAGGYSGHPWTSENKGATWTEQTSSDLHDWYFFGANHDGSLLAAVAYSDAVYLSTDRGATWVRQAQSISVAQVVGDIAGRWTAFKMSDDGSTMILGEYNGTNLAYPVASFDGGATWAQVTGAGQHPWDDFAVSADGNILYAISRSTYSVSSPALWKSADRGVTWSQITTVPGYGASVFTSFRYRGLDCSADGMIVSISTYNGSTTHDLYLYSLDGGATWTSSEIPYNPLSAVDFHALTGQQTTQSAIATNADGSLTFIAATDGVYKSVDHCKTFTKIYAVVASFGAAAIVGDYTCQHLFMVDSNGNGYTSSDYGATWTPRTIPFSSFNFISNIADAGLMIAGDSANTYTSSDYGATWATRTGQVFLSAAPAGNGSIIYAAQSGTHKIRQSTDGGATWSDTLTASDNYTLVSVNQDGSVILAASATQIFFSTNSGSSWTSMSATWTTANYLKCSRDGTTFVIASTNGTINRSIDQGAHWQDPWSVASDYYLDLSADGIYAYIIGDGNHVTTLRDWLTSSLGLPTISADGSTQFLGNNGPLYSGGPNASVALKSHDHFATWEVITPDDSAGYYYADTNSDGSFWISLSYNYYYFDAYDANSPFSLAKSAGKGVGVSSVSNLSLIKSAARTLALVATTTLKNNIGRFKSLAVSCASAASKVLQARHAASIGSTTATSLKKSTGRILAIANTSALTIKKLVSRTYSIPSTSAVAVKKAATRSISFGSNTASSIRKSAGKLITAGLTSTVAAPKSVFKGVGLVITTTLTTISQNVKIVVLSIASGTSATLTNGTGKITHVATTSVLSLGRGVARALNINSPTTIGIIAGLSFSCIVLIDSITTVSIGARRAVTKFVVALLDVATAVSNRNRTRKVSIIPASFTVASNRRIGKSAAVVSLTTSSLRRSAGKIARIPGATIVALRRAASVSLAALSFVLYLQFIKNASRTIDIATSSTISPVKRVAKAFSTSSQTALAQRKTAGRVASILATTASSIRKTFPKVLNIAADLKTALTRRVNKSLTAVSVTTSKATRGVSKGFLFAASSTLRAVKTPGKAFSLAATSTLGLSKRVGVTRNFDVTFFLIRVNKQIAKAIIAGIQSTTGLSQYGAGPNQSKLRQYINGQWVPVPVYDYIAGQWVPLVTRFYRDGDWQ